MNKHQQRQLKALRMKCHNLPRRMAQTAVFEAISTLCREKTEWGGQRYPYGNHAYPIIQAHEELLEEIDRRPFRKSDWGEFRR